MVSRQDLPLVVWSLNFFATPNDRWCGAFRGGGLGERIGRKSGTSAGRWSGPTLTIGWNGGQEYWLIWVKGDPTEDRGGLGGYQNILIMLVVILVAVRAHDLNLGGGMRRGP